MIKVTLAKLTKIRLQQIGSEWLWREITKKLTSVRRYAECKTKYRIFTRTYIERISHLAKTLEISKMAFAYDC